MDDSGQSAIATGPPPRILAAGDKCWILSITVQKDGVQFKLYTDPDDSGVRHRGDLKFPFPNKKQVPTTDEMLATIAEVLTVVPAADQPAQAANTSSAPNPAESGLQATVSGKYLMDKGGAELDIVSDTGCTMLIPGSQPAVGFYQVSGDTLTIRCTVSGYSFSFKVQGNKLVADNGQVWIQQGSTPAPPAHQYDDLSAPPPPPAPAPTIKIGERKAQVVTDFGEPQRKAATGPKEIYFYTDLKMKVTFVNGKVSSIE
jgi:hypothetical protein